MLDDSPIVELVVDDDEDECKDDSDDANDYHWNVNGEGNCLDVRLNDCPILRDFSFRPLHQLIAWDKVNR